MTWEQLPLELVEAIFDHLLDDKRALKVCSLVCKAWLYSAYRRLFYDTRLRWVRLRTVFDPRSESIAAPFIRRLCVAQGSSREWNETFPSLDGFHSVTSLSLKALYWDEILPDIRSTISTRFIAITRLEFRYLIVATFSDFARIICTFRCLENLIIGSAHWVRSDKACSLLRLPDRLHALELDGEDSTEILEWLCSFGQNLALRNLCLMSCGQHHYQVINTLLQILGPSLESFRIRLRGLNLPVCLHPCTHLRFLHLDVWRAVEGETGLASVLSNVISVRIEGISLRLRHTRSPSDDTTFHDCVPMEWGEVDTILARPQFSNLKTLSVRHARDGFYSPLEWFFDRLPLCHKRGILRSCGSDPWPPFI